MFKVIAIGSPEHKEIAEKTDRFNACISGVLKCVADNGQLILNTNLEVRPLPDTDLKTMQNVVGGLIEITACLLFPHMELVVNEEGRVRGLPFNEIATIVAGQPIFGDAILLPVGAIA